jgi:hypothetical protein
MIKSHYLFVASAAGPSFIRGGFRGLNGSQVNKISIAAPLLTRPSVEDSRMVGCGLFHWFSLYDPTT